MMYRPLSVREHVVDKLVRDVIKNWQRNLLLYFIDVKIVYTKKAQSILPDV